MTPQSVIFQESPSKHGSLQQSAVAVKIASARKHKARCNYAKLVISLLSNLCSVGSSPWLNRQQQDVTPPYCLVRESLNSPPNNNLHCSCSCQWWSNKNTLRLVVITKKRRAQAIPIYLPTSADAGRQLGVRISGGGVDAASCCWGRRDGCWKSSLWINVGRCNNPLIILKTYYYYGLFVPVFYLKCRNSCVIHDFRRSQRKGLPNKGPPPHRCCQYRPYEKTIVQNP